LRGVGGLTIDLPVDVSFGLRPPDQDRCLQPLGHLSDVFRIFTSAACAASAGEANATRSGVASFD